MLLSDKKMYKLDYSEEHVQRKKGSDVFHWSFLACILKTDNNNNRKKKTMSVNGWRIVCVCICSPKNTEMIFLFSFSILFFSFSLGCRSSIQWWLGRRLIIYIASRPDKRRLSNNSCRNSRRRRRRKRKNFGWRNSTKIRLYYI
jgi:hypothetical protein